MTGKNRFLPLAVLCVVLWVSCGAVEITPQGSEQVLFWAQNMETGAFYQVSAEKLAEGNKCVVWGEIGSGATETLALQVVNEYDNIIRPRVVENFGEKNFRDDYDGSFFVDILDYANWLADRNDRKLTILLLDIKDGFRDRETDTFVAGYFSLINFYGPGPVVLGGRLYYGNARDMIYIDTKPGLEKETRQTFATLAHELQHLINFVSSYRHRVRNVGGRPTIYVTDTWVDEGLSAYAEYLYLEENPHEKCMWFSEDPEGTIAKGNNFFVWGNHDDINTAILDDYATVYLFFRWLYLQADEGLKSHILMNIEISEENDYKAITAEAAKIKSEWRDWESLLMNWLAANNDPGNLLYGYKGDSYLQSKENIKVTPIAVGGNKISLYPGEGVYSIMDVPINSSSLVSSTNIRYAGLDNTITTGTTLTGTMLLTFNANAENYDWDTEKVPNSEEGSLTGVPPPSASWLPARSVQTSKFTGPYRIDARDLLARERGKKLPGFLAPFRNEDE